MSLTQRPGFRFGGAAFEPETWGTAGDDSAGRRSACGASRPDPVDRLVELIRLLSKASSRSGIPGLACRGRGVWFNSAAFVAVFALAAVEGRAADPYADEVVSYVGGATSGFFPDPQTALGEPSRFSAHPDYPSVVSLVSPAYQASQVVEIGPGGSLVVRFNEPVLDRPSNLYGMDLIIFGNSFFEVNFAQGRLSHPASVTADGTGVIEVSSDGVNFFRIPGVMPDYLFPTQGYQDADAFSATPGMFPSSFQKPMDPALTLSSFDGLEYGQAIALYGGSGGGASVDIASAVDAQGNPAGLTSISYVRVSNLGGEAVEIDGFSAVPEPATALLLSFVLAMAGRCRRR